LARGTDEIGDGLKAENFPEESPDGEPLDGSAHFGSRERVDDFMVSHGDTYGNGYSVEVPNAFLDQLGPENIFDNGDEGIEYLIHSDLFGVFNGFPRTPSP
jgi:hypothetical protein